VTSLVEGLVCAKDMTDFAHHFNTFWPLPLQAGVAVNTLFKFAISVLMSFSSTLWSWC